MVCMKMVSTPVDIGVERGLFLRNTFFQHKMIHRFTWRRGEERGSK